VEREVDGSGRSSAGVTCYTHMPYVTWHVALAVGGHPRPDPRLFALK